MGGPEGPTHVARLEFPRETGLILRCAGTDAGRDWGQEEKGMTEDEMVGWRNRLSGHDMGLVDSGSG